MCYGIGVGLGKLELKGEGRGGEEVYYPRTTGVVQSEVVMSQLKRA